MMTTLTSADLEAELSAAKSRLAQLQNQQQNKNGPRQPNATGTSTDICKNNDGASESAAQKLYQRAQIAQDEIEYIALNRHVIKIMTEKSNTNNSHIEQQEGADAAAGEGHRDVLSLTKATDRCTNLGLLLLQHSKQHKNNHNPPPQYQINWKSNQLYNALNEWYKSLYKSTHIKAIQTFRSKIRKLAPEYPSNEHSSTLIVQALSCSNSSSTES